MDEKFGQMSVNTAMGMSVDTSFLLGFPRSGTTWVSNLINAHPDVVYRHELYGRSFQRFGGELYSNLKFGNGVSDSEYKQALQVALLAFPEADRPPFFPKSYVSGLRSSVRKLAWMMASSFPLAEGLYARAYSPRRPDQTHLVIKETRSSVNIVSLMEGLRSARTVILVRHPYSVIASHLAGQAKGLMSSRTDEQKSSWYKANRGNDYILASGLELKTVKSMPDVEFIALQWVVQNTDYLRLVGSREAKVFCYEDFVRDPRTQILELYTFLGLDVSEQTRAFIDESTSSKRVPLSKRDASSEFYSVFRGPSFEPDKWRNSITEELAEFIDKHCKGLIDEMDCFDQTEFNLAKPA